MSHTLLATPSPFPLIDTKPFPALPLCSPPVISQFSIAIGLLAVSHLPADADTDPQHPHSALLLHCLLQVLPGACILAFASAMPALSGVHITLDLPLALCQTHQHFCSLNLAASSSYSSHCPYTAPPADCDFSSRPHPHCFYILDTGLHSTLDFVPAFAVRRSCTPRAWPSSHFPLLLFTVHLMHTVPTSVPHSFHTTPPNL
jgi:hypothetical protein